MAYGVLTLYAAVCPADGCPEFDTSVHIGSHLGAPIRYAKEMVGERYSDKKSLRISQNILASASDAPFLVEYAENHIRGASGLLKILTCKDGEITFQRTIEFLGWRRKNQEDLIELLVKSGYTPYSSRIEADQRILSNEHAGETTKAAARERIEKFDYNSVWQNALTFHTK